MFGKYSIGDLERLSGIKAHTLRIWEQRYKILNPERTGTNIRFYGNDDLKRILNISLLNNNGFKISMIARLNDKELLREVEKFLSSFAKESDQIESLVLCLMDLNEERFETTINNSVIHFGFENTVEKVIFPFLRQMGNMWLLGIISPAQGHFISNLIRQKLIVGINNIAHLTNAASKTFLFFLPEGELHELGLFYTHYLTKKLGHKCVYLGQSVPLEDLIAIAQNVKPDVIVGIFTAKTPDVEIHSFLKTCDEQILEPEFFLSGLLLLGQGKNFKMPAKRFRLFEDFHAYKVLLSGAKN